VAIIELSIKETYVPSWGTWECLREAMQNGMDEDKRGYKLTVKYRNGQLHIQNIGADMTTEALLMGETDKAENAELLGEHGEGLGVGILAGVRAGYDITIRTQTEIWKPFIGSSNNFRGRNVLKVRTRKLKVRRGDVTVSITMPEETWEEAKDLFLPFATLDRAKHLIEIEGRGAIIRDEKFKGRVYVKGIFVQHIPELVMGYNLLDFRVDRDRRLIDTWNLKWELASMYREAIRKRPEAMAPEVYAMLRDGKMDTQSLEHNSDEEVTEALAQEFIAEHGENSVPVKSIGEAVDISNANKHGVVVNDTLAKVLAASRTVQTSEEVKQALAKSITATYSWSDLTAIEQANLQAAAAIVDAVLPSFLESHHVEPVLNIIQVADFYQEDLVGEIRDGRVVLARKVLTTQEEILEHLVHELAHIISGADDGMIRHTRAIESLWSALYWKGRGN